MPPPQVSIVVSTVNRSELLEVVLSSLNQDVADDFNYDVIVVDNSSADATCGVVVQLIDSGAHRLRYAVEPRQRMCFGRDARILFAQAPIVTVTADDRLVERNWVRRLAQVFSQGPEVGDRGRSDPAVMAWTVPSWLTEDHSLPLAILAYGAAPFYTSRQSPRRDALNVSYHPK